MFAEPKLKFTYKCDDNILITSGDCDDADFLYRKENNKYSVWIIAHKQLQPRYCGLQFDCDYKKTDKVFANGYQSWSHSREYGYNDVQKGLRFLVKKGITRKYATITGDYDFAHYSGKKGDCHSFYYTYIRRENGFEFLGSLDENQGYTIFYHSMQSKKLIVEKDLQVLTLKAGERYKLYDLYFDSGDKDKIFDNYFEELGIEKKNLQKLNGYTSWYNLFGKITEKTVRRDLQGLYQKVGDKANIFQIDDGYQTAVGDWLDVDKQKFPSGMKALCDEIHAKGYKAGIWLAPTVCAKNSKIAKEHPDWLICKNSKPIIGAIAWGGAYVLDYSKKEVREYIKNVFDTVLNDWGFDMVKLDFLYSEAYLPKNNKTRGEIMQDTMKFLRACVGDKLLLGCGVPMFSAFGNCDYCRVGSDVDLSFKERLFSKITNNEIVSSYNAITSSLFRHHLNDRAFGNDPDVFFLRCDNLKFSKNQKKLLAKLNSIAGRVLFVSDNAGDYDEWQLATLKEAYSANATIKDVVYVKKNIVKVQYLEDGNDRQIAFNIRNGKTL